jgi:hypothetical protein
MVPEGARTGPRAISKNIIRAKTRELVKKRERNPGRTRRGSWYGVRRGQSKERRISEGRVRCRRGEIDSAERRTKDEFRRGGK